MDIAIIVVAYNRPDSLDRLFSSLSKVFCPEGLKPELIISIDNSGNDECFDIARAFNWKCGAKSVIRHESRLGLKDHILKCGNLSSGYDFIILLEDDLYVSEYVLDFSIKAYERYQSESKVAGISLYSYHFNETALKNFDPLNDGNDVYFLQLPSSWGQIWTAEQWLRFREWLENDYTQNIIAEYLIPENIINWPDTSWKKLFVFYMVIKDLYFVYPRLSLTTNFMDTGVHYEAKGSYLQVALQSYAIDYKFADIGSTDLFYDSFCELSPGKFKKGMKQLEEFDFEIDLYGTKPLDKIKCAYILTSRLSFNSIFQYALSLKPHELNVLNEVKGSDVFFARASTVSDSRYKTTEIERNSYYYSVPKHLLRLKNPDRVVERASSGRGDSIEGLQLERVIAAVKDFLYIAVRKLFPSGSKRRDSLLAILGWFGR